MRILLLDEKILKFQLSFSMQTVSNSFNIRVKVYYAFKINKENSALLVEIGEASLFKYVDINYLKPNITLLLKYYSEKCSLTLFLSIL